MSREHLYLSKYNGFKQIHILAIAMVLFCVTVFTILIIEIIYAAIVVLFQMFFTIIALCSVIWISRKYHVTELRSNCFQCGLV